MSQSDPLTDRYRLAVERLNQLAASVETAAQKMLESLDTSASEEVLQRWYRAQMESFSQALKDAGLGDTTGLLPQEPFAGVDPGSDSPEQSSTQVGQALAELEEILATLEGWVATSQAMSDQLTQGRDHLRQRALRAQAEVLEAMATARSKLPLPPPLPDPYANQRKERRVDVEVPVSVEADTHLWFGSSENCSAAGVFVATPFLLKPGTGVLLSLLFQDGEPVASPGTVVWAREANVEQGVVAGMGVELSEASHDLHHRLAQILPTERTEESTE